MLSAYLDTMDTIQILFQFQNYSINLCQQSVLSEALNYLKKIAIFL